MQSPLEFLKNSLFFTVFNDVDDDEMKGGGPKCLPIDWGLVRGQGGEVQINNNCVVGGMTESGMTVY